MQTLQEKFNQDKSDNTESSERSEPRWLIVLAVVVVVGVVLACATALWSLTHPKSDVATTPTPVASRPVPSNNPSPSPVTTHVQTKEMEMPICSSRITSSTTVTFTLPNGTVTAPFDLALRLKVGSAYKATVEVTNYTDNKGLLVYPPTTRLVSVDDTVLLKIDVVSQCVRSVIPTKPSPNQSIPSTPSSNATPPPPTPGGYNGGVNPLTPYPVDTGTHTGSIQPPSF